ncbi:MAG: EamA family transporter [Oscillatoria sp. PMC 1068.18]|nr:EamA family transporter [Oscillatoria sp. PMC 1076.18]MEC4989838.1 EamA family transporter [Oscillatoria sp. PMC 1068.18]
MSSQLAPETAAVVEAEKSGNWLPIAALAVGLIAAAFVPLIVRWCEMELSPEATIFNRCWIAALILAVWQGFQALRFPKSEANLSMSQQQANSEVETNEAESRHQYLIWGITLISFAAMPVIWAWSLTQTSVANSALMHNLTPLFTTLGGWLVFQTRFERRFLLGTSIALIGTIALSVNDFQLDVHKIQGDLLALGSAVFFAIQLMGTERLGTRVSSLKILFYASLTGVVVNFVVTLILGERLFPVSLNGWLAAAGLAIVGQVVALGLFAYSASQLSASLVALVLLLDPVFSAIAAWLAFGETLNLWNAIAFGIVLLGVYLGVSATKR